MRLHVFITILLSFISYNIYALELKGENDSNEDISITFALHVFKISKALRNNGEYNTLSIQYGDDKYIINSVQKLEYYQTLVKRKVIKIKKKSQSIDYAGLGYIPPNNKYLLPLPLMHSKQQYLYCFYYNINDQSSGIIVNNVNHQGILIKVSKSQEYTVEYF